MENKEEHDGLLDIALEWQNSLEPQQQVMVRYLKQVADKQGYMRAEEEMKKRVGLLRQWLNEDRITDTGRMVDNWQIERFLFPKAHDVISKLKEKI